MKPSGIEWLENVPTHWATLRAFGRWMVQARRATTNPLAGLSRVMGADADRDDFRTLNPAEIGYVVAYVDRSDERHRLTGPERAMLYRFAFESGLRPLTLRGLTVSAFDFEAIPPTVTAAAKTMKRRKAHVQALRSESAAELARLLDGKMPEAAAFRMPSKYNKYNLADMIRADTADARAAWIKEADGDPEEQLARKRSNFLSE